MKNIVLAALFLALIPDTANAAMSQALSKNYCGPSNEVDAMLSGFDVVLEGVAGVAGRNGRGRVMINKTTNEWFFVQYELSENFSCVVLGGDNIRVFVKGNKT